MRWLSGYLWGDKIICGNGFQHTHILDRHLAQTLNFLPYIPHFISSFVIFFIPISFHINWWFNHLHHDYRLSTSLYCHFYLFIQHDCIDIIFKLHIPKDFLSVLCPTADVSVWYLRIVINKVESQRAEICQILLSLSKDFGRANDIYLAAVQNPPRKTSSSSG